jgi:endoglucanase
MKKIVTLFFLFISVQLFAQTSKQQMHLNDKEYLEYQGVNVMLAWDFYPEGHQGGVGVIQNGERVATNGDIRLNPTPGQWQPIPKVGTRVVDKKTGMISVHMAYPNEAIDRKGFNPVIYPDLKFGYTIHVEPAGKAFKIIVDLDSALPDEWIGKVGFNFELLPSVLFGKSYYMDKQFGIFPRQSNDQTYTDDEGETQVRPMATGNKLIVAPENDRQRMTIENLDGNDLQLLDGRGKYNNGWFVVRSLLQKGKVKGAVEWLVTPHAIDGWMSKPVVQVSQVGYHPAQQKIAVIELDAKDKRKMNAWLLRINENGGFENVLQSTPKDWGNFLRYHYLQFDFSKVKKPGMYVVKYGNDTTNVFQISDSVYAENVWQPTLEYFLPAQMCHMRVNDKYKVWHGFCHMDDARMAPIDSNHFDGYIQGASTLTKYKSGETVPGLNAGGWHDAGDFDLRVESQAETVYGLTLAYETFDVKYDNTTINQHTHVVEIQQPDSKPDVLQQIEHGLLSIIGGYKSMGRFYRGIIEPTMRQYTTLGDPANITDNKFYNDVKSAVDTPAVGLPNSPDDRWVFTEDNPGRSLETAAALAAANRVMAGFNDTLANDCLNIAQQVWENTKEKNPAQRIGLATELYITTKDKKYADFLLANKDVIARQINNYGWQIGRTLPMINNTSFSKTITDAVTILFDTIKLQSKETPYQVPYKPNIWGAGWDIQHFGYKQYFLHAAFPKIVTDEYMLASLNFILGCHPGSNTASFASGVGAHSMIPAYGFNRADWYYIPGGISSGTALIRPDFPELLAFPFLWQQGEYVLGGGTTDYLFLVLAANKVLNEKN